MPLIITPQWVGSPERMGRRRGWGFATQLYSVRSQQSWGVGDLTDLEDLAVWSAAEHDADFVLVNPLHAAEPVAPMEPSPYLPSSRRFANPLYLRPERIPEYAVADAEWREAIEVIKAKLGAASADQLGLIVIARGRPSATPLRSSFRCRGLLAGKPPSPRIGVARAAACRGSQTGLRCGGVWPELLGLAGRTAGSPSAAVAAFAVASPPRSTSTAGCSG